MDVHSLAEQLFFTTVRVDTTAPDGSRGSGTAFLFTYSVGGSDYPFVVTNKHVVEGTESGSLTFCIGKDSKPDLGNGFRIDVTDWTSAWFGHPAPDIDITVCPFAPLENVAKTQGKELFFRYASAAMVPSAAQLEKLDALEAVTFIGYPNGVWDRKNLIPVARRGHAATPLSVDFEGQPKFLIDASVFGGSSGSPVFIVNQGMYTDKTGTTVVGSRILFLGVVAAVYFRTQLNEIIPAPIPTQKLPTVRNAEMIDLGIVFKARTVVETAEAFLRYRGVVIP